MILVTRDNLEKGRRVINEDGAIGKIKKCRDLHNVYVKYKNGGAGLYCFAEGCSENSKEGSLLHYCDK